MTLKVHETGHRQAANETTIFNHLRDRPQGDQSYQGGQQLIRKLLKSFEVGGPIGRHVCLVYWPLCMSLEDLRLTTEDKAIPLEALKPLIRLTLLGLSYLHDISKVVHAG